MIDKPKWERLVVNPVMKALGDRYANTNYMADALHVTNFILKAVEQELVNMIQHVAQTNRQHDFACMVSLASAAPKSVYGALCTVICPICSRGEQSVWKNTG